MSLIPSFFISSRLKGFTALSAGYIEGSFHIRLFRNKRRAYAFVVTITAKLMGVLIRISRLFINISEKPWGHLFSNIFGFFNKLTLKLHNFIFKFMILIIERMDMHFSIQYRIERLPLNEE